LNIGFTLTAIKFCATGFLHIAGATRATRMGIIDFGRINIIAEAMYHDVHLLHLRMIVNNFANDLQNQVLLWLIERKDLLSIIPDIAI